MTLHLTVTINLNDGYEFTDLTTTAVGWDDVGRAVRALIATYGVEDRVSSVVITAVT